MKNNVALEAVTKWIEESTEEDFIKNFNKLEDQYTGITIGEYLDEYGSDVSNELTDKGYVILPTEPLSEEDKKQRKAVPVTFIVKLPNLERI